MPEDKKESAENMKAAVREVLSEVKDGEKTAKQGVAEVSELNRRLTEMENKYPKDAELQSVVESVRSEITAIDERLRNLESKGVVEEKEPKKPFFDLFEDDSEPEITEGVSNDE